MPEDFLSGADHADSRGDQRDDGAGKGTCKRAPSENQCGEITQKIKAERLR